MESNNVDKCNCDIINLIQHLHVYVCIGTCIFVKHLTRSPVADNGACGKGRQK